MKWRKQYTELTTEHHHIIDSMGLEGLGIWHRLHDIVAREITRNHPEPELTLPVSTWTRLMPISSRKLRRFLEQFAADISQQNAKDSSIFFRFTRQNGRIVLTIKIPNVLRLKDEYSRKALKMSGHPPDNVQPKEYIEDRSVEDRKKEKEKDLHMEVQPSHSRTSSTQDVDPSRLSVTPRGGPTVSPSVPTRGEAVHTGTADLLTGQSVPTSSGAVPPGKDDLQKGQSVPNTSKAGSGSGRKKKDEADPWKVIEYWNSLADKYDLRKTRVGPTKKANQLTKKIKAKHMTFEEWKEYLDTITSAPYTRPGQGGDAVKDWVASLVWALENKTFARYEAGGFDQYKAAAPADIVDIRALWREYHERQRQQGNE